MKNRSKYISVLLLSIIFVAIGFSLSGFHIHHHDFEISLEKHNYSHNESEPHCDRGTIVEYLFSCLFMIKQGNLQKSSVAIDITDKNYCNIYLIEATVKSFLEFDNIFSYQKFICKTLQERAPPVQV